MPASIKRRRLDDPRPPVARLVAEQAFQLTQRLAALPIGVGMNEIVETFGFGEIELAVLERAAGEFAGLGRHAHFRIRASAANNAASTARPPWTWNSATSSPVALAGPGNHSTTASSIGRWPTSRSSARVAVRGDGIFPPAPSGRFRPAGRRPAQSRSRSAAGRTTARRWSGLADASPICAGGPEKATPFQFGQSGLSGVRQPRCRAGSAVYLTALPQLPISV